MAEIPYHKWLGLDSKIKNPHHFQLLGVSSKVEDADAYRLQVLAAAQTKLEMLDRVRGTEHEKLVGQLRHASTIREMCLATRKNGQNTSSS